MLTENLKIFDRDNKFSPCDQELDISNACIDNDSLDETDELTLGDALRRHEKVIVTINFHPVMKS